MTTDTSRRAGRARLFPTTLRRHAPVATGRDGARSTVPAQPAVVASTLRPAAPQLGWRVTDQCLVMRWTLATAR